MREGEREVAKESGRNNIGSGGKEERERCGREARMGRMGEREGGVKESGRRERGSSGEEGKSQEEEERRAGKTGERWREREERESGERDGGREG